MPRAKGLGPLLDHEASNAILTPHVPAMIAAEIGEGAAPIEARIERELANDLGYTDRCLGDRDYLLGSELSVADIQLSSVGELAGRWTTVRAIQPSKPGCAVSGRVQRTSPRSRAAAPTLSRRKAGVRLHRIARLRLRSAWRCRTSRAAPWPGILTDRCRSTCGKCA